MKRLYTITSFIVVVLFTACIGWLQTGAEFEGYRVNNMLVLLVVLWLWVAFWYEAIKENK